MYHMVPPDSQPTWDSVMSIMSWKKRHNVRKIRMKSTHNIEPNELDGVILGYCRSKSLSDPEFVSKLTFDDGDQAGTSKFKVWVVLGKERLELPISYANEAEGRERAARLVLQRLRAKRS